MIETLKDDSQILLLYLADELPAEDRRRIELRLSSEPSLAFALDHLRLTYAQIEDGLARLDTLSGLPLTADTAARTVGREMRKRMAAPKVIAPAVPARDQWRLRPWLIPTAVAASIVVGALVWIDRDGIGKKQVVAIPPEAPNQPSVQPDETLALFNVSFRSTAPELADAVATGNSRRDTAPQDDVSQFLLNVERTQD